MNLARFVSLLNYHAREGLHLVSPFDFKVLLVQGSEFILYRITGVYVHHIINKQTMDNVFVTSALHEDSLLDVHCQISILLHLY